MNFAVLDHKLMGDTGMVKLRTQGPSRLYYIQLLLYALGYVRAGRRVDHIGIIGYPRTGSTIQAIYTWSEPVTPASAAVLTGVVADLARRKAYAAQLSAGTRTLDSIPAVPDTCIFCPIRGMCADSSG